MNGCAVAPASRRSTWSFVRGRWRTSAAPARNRREAERELHRIAAAEDAGTFEPVRKIGFTDWGDLWLDGLERRKNTVRGYESVMRRAKRALGQKPVKRITVDDIRGLLAGMREDGLSDSTRAKHLRVLGACFASAVESGYAGQNVARRLSRDSRPKPVKKESAYFEADETRRLFAQLEPGLYRVLFEAALKTGMRLGELSGLTWGDVDLAEAVIRVRRSFTDGEVGPTKSGERRDVDLTDELVELLGRVVGRPGPAG